MEILKRQCRNCEYAVTGAIDPNNVSAERAVYCRRNPPQLAPLSQRGNVVGITSMFPAIAAESWCGEYVSWHTKRADRPPEAPKKIEG